MSRVAEVQPVFVRKKHELTGLLKELDQGSKEAVAMLVETMKQPPEKVGYDLKVKCAQILVETHAKVGDIVAKDSLTRSVAEFKLSGGNGNLGFSEEQKRSAPRIDFNTVQEFESA